MAAVFAAAFWFSTAHAAVYFNTAGGNTFYNNPSGVAEGIGIGQPLLSGGTHSYFIRWQVGCEIGATPNRQCSVNHVFNFYYFSNSAYSGGPAGGATFVGPVDISSATGTYNGTSSWTGSLDASKWYMLITVDAYSGGQSGAFLSTLPSSYSTGHWINGVGGNFHDGTPYFCMGDTEADCPPFGPPPASVYLYAPTSTVPDFENWVISETNAPSSSYYLAVDYGLSSSSFTYTDIASFSPFVSTNPTPLTKTQSLWFPPLSIPAIWYAQAYLLDYSHNVLASSPIETFEIDPNAPMCTVCSIEATLAIFHSLGGGETSSTIPTTANCDTTSSSFLGDPVGNIQSGICNALSFLFIPNSAEKADIGNRFSSLGNQIKNKPPFGYFTSAIDAFSSSSFSDSATSSVVSTSTAAAFAGIFVLLDNGIAILLWLGFALWLIRTIRKLDT
jgi:hypothetical protein